MGRKSPRDRVDSPPERWARFPSRFYMRVDKNKDGTEGFSMFFGRQLHDLHGEPVTFQIERNASLQVVRSTARIGFASTKCILQI